MSPETTYEITLQANRGSYSSDVYTQQFTTAAIPFSKYYVTDVKATAVGKQASRLHGKVWKQQMITW